MQEGDDHIAPEQASMTHPLSAPFTRRSRALAPLIAASALVAIAPRAAVAQGEAPDCLAIVAEMLTPTPSPGAIRASAGCPSTGPVTLANRWSRRGSRTAAERAALVEASTWMRDARLYEAVSSVVGDGTRPLSDRMAGLRVLTSYADDGGSVMQQGQARSAKAVELSAGRDDASTVAGSNALRPTVREDVERELSRLAREDRDPDMRYAAQRASESLGYVAPRGAKVMRYPKP